MCGFLKEQPVQNSVFDRCPFDCVQAGGDRRRNSRKEETVMVFVSVCVHVRLYLRMGVCVVSE